MSTTFAERRIKVGRAAHGRHIYITATLTDDRLSMTGEIGAMENGNGDSYGQNGDTIAAMLESRELTPEIPRAELRELLAIWDRWHLNDMRAGCEHQRAGIATGDDDEHAGTPWNARPIDSDKPTNTYGTHYPGQRSASWNMLGWVRPEEYAPGLLTRPCPECGYRYGSAWMTEEIPEDVRARLEELTRRD